MRFNQRAIDGEMFVRHLGGDVGMMQQCFHEAGEHIALLQSLAILCKRRRIPHPHRPA